MRVLFIQHDHTSPVGPVGARFAHHGFDVDELLVVPADRFDDPGVEVQFPDPTHYDVVVNTDVLTATQAAAIVCGAARVAGS